MPETAILATVTNAVLLALLAFREWVSSRRVADLERQLTRALSAQSGVSLEPRPQGKRERPEELTDPYLVP